jgi:hypothetical protein
MMQLHGDRPIRHGFQAVGVKHGQHTGFHTGPCQGTRFPHLGISSEGTQWALDHTRKLLDATNAELERLASHPDLTWYPMDPRRADRRDFSRPVTLRYGEPEAFVGDGRPTYAWQHKREVAEQQARKNSLESMIDRYEKVLATWSPEKYPMKGAAAKAETVHMATPRKHTRYGDWTGVLCRYTKPGYASDKLPKTNDPGKVTCKRCRTALGLPAL